MILYGVLGDGGRGEEAMAALKVTEEEAHELDAVEAARRIIHNRMSDMQKDLNALFERVNDLDERIYARRWGR